MILLEHTVVRLASWIKDGSKIQNRQVYVTALVKHAYDIIDLIF